MPPFRILLVDDSREFLEAAGRFLATDPRIEIIARARSGRQAMEQVSQLGPHLVLMDLAMPEMNGLEAIQGIKAKPGAPRVVILTLYDSPEHRDLAAAAGADGFLSKMEFCERSLPLIYKLLADPAHDIGTATDAMHDDERRSPGEIA